MDNYSLQDKTIYIQEDETKKSQKYSIKISRTDQFVDLNSILMQIPNYQNKNFQIYCPSEDAYVDFQNICVEQFLIPISYLQLQYILIKYKQQDRSDTQNHSQQNKKQRSKERNIKQVIQLVHKWRQLHESSTDGKKINLQQAAKIVGISKKSLDDYFFQLRMGEKYGFDYIRNMDGKIGILRSFVKEKDSESKKNQKLKTVVRYPKKLKILQQFSNKLNSKDRVQIKIQTKQQKDIVNESNCNNNQCKNLVDSLQLFWGSPFTPIQQKAFMDCQQNFFKDFENLMQQPNDPFIPFANFKKSRSIFSDENSHSNIDF